MGKNMNRWMLGRVMLGRWTIGTLAAGLAGAAATPALTQPVVQVLNRQSEPMSLQGMSGGTVASDCGNISAQPSQQLQLTQESVQSSGYLRFVVEGAGDPTLLIEGPTGRFCVLSDRAMNKGPEAVGYWLPGTYKIYVGDRQSQSHPYQLSILSE